MSKHTPGPWRAYCRDVGYSGGEWAEDYFLQWEVAGPRAPDGRGDFYQADARLIAAAPELLEALDELVEEWFDEETMADDPFWTRARAAIAKAKGDAA